uniref:Uncharacterized protein n=1 Tax=Romanomermis culicivorax TaxID=13658 RepID=A0A915J3B3_ROMCU
MLRRLSCPIQFSILKITPLIIRYFENLFRGFAEQDRETMDGFISWRCDQKDCKGRVKTHAENHGIARIFTPHTCAIDLSRAE